MDSDLITLCALKDLDDPGAKGFDLDFNLDRYGRPLRIIVTRLGDKAFGWINSCPHAWVPLDVEPNQFMDMTGQFLLCSYHGAAFTLGSGVCLRGPCKGRKLMSFPLKLEDGMIKIKTSEQEHP
jgi:nitrite reductase/ring-hydroxylating ferredoxin subunit